jgi:hypothetical protein
MKPLFVPIYIRLWYKKYNKAIKRTKNSWLFHFVHIIAKHFLAAYCDVMFFEIEIESCNQICNVKLLPVKFIFTDINFNWFSNNTRWGSIPLPELPVLIQISVVFLLLSIIPVWIWVLVKTFKSRYFVWFIITLFLPPISFFITFKRNKV